MATEGGDKKYNVSDPQFENYSHICDICTNRENLPAKLTDQSVS